MNKVLRIGDPHAKVTNLVETDRLIKYARHIAKEEKVDWIEILGDLFHTHSILRLEVLDFWKRALLLLAADFEVRVIVGNHDQTGDYNSHISALDVFSDIHEKLIIIKSPVKIGVYAYVPYIHSGVHFLEQCNSLSAQGAKVLVCHQTFSGSKFENGLYAPEGINPDDLKFGTIISGHIHAQQRFGNVIYPGTARWDTISDANQPKGLWIYTHGPDGSIQSETFHSTDGICKPIYCFTYTEGDKEAPQWKNENAAVAIELIGSSSWVATQKINFKGKCAIKTKITDTKKTESRKSGESFDHYLRNYFVSTMDRERLISLAKEMGIV